MYAHKLHSHVCLIEHFVNRQDRKHFLRQSESVRHLTNWLISALKAELISGSLSCFVSCIFISLASDIEISIEK